MPRLVSVEFRGRTLRRRLAAGELLEVPIAGTPRDREALPPASHLPAAAAAGGP